MNERSENVQLPTDERDQRARLNAQESAYAVAGYQLPNGDLIYGAPGLTKREYFAALAMQGLMTSSSRNDDPHLMAIRATNAADALLKELAK